MLITQRWLLPIMALLDNRHGSQNSYEVEGGRCVCGKKFVPGTIHFLFLEDFVLQPFCTDFLGHGSGWGLENDYS